MSRIIRNEFEIFLYILETVCDAPTQRRTESIV